MAMTIEENKKIDCPFLKTKCKANKCNLFAYVPPDEKGNDRGTCSFRWIPSIADRLVDLIKGMVNQQQIINEKITEMIDLMKEDNEKH